jgi:lipid-A-disaccharide synthase-like uncharacterized protein
MIETITSPWIIIGLIGQIAFGLRFVIQWISSEREGRSIVPLAFWYFSVVGGSILLIYAIHRRDPVFILGQAGGLAIYVRNLVLIHRRRDPESS